MRLAAWISGCALVVLVTSVAFAQDPENCIAFVGVQHDSNQWALAQLAQERAETRKLREKIAALTKELEAVKKPEAKP